MLGCLSHVIGETMTDPENRKPQFMDVPAFLRDPQPSKPMRCPTLLVAWLRSSSTSPQQAERRGDDNDKTGHDPRD